MSIIFLNFFLIVSSQKDSTFLKKNRLPYDKTKGLKLIYLGLSPSFQFSTPRFDYALDIGISPTFAYYFNKKIEAVIRYGFSYVKYGSLNPVNADGFNEFLVSAHYYPFNKINFLYLQGGILYGNYWVEKVNRYLLKEWNKGVTCGFGIEVLTKKKFVINFDAAYVIPFRSKYDFNLYRSVGLGFQLDKWRK